MAKNALIEALRADDPKSGLFDNQATIISYETGFPVLDYFLGYTRRVYDDDNNVIEEFPSVGISSGCYACFIGKPSTGKTTMAVQIAANIVRNYENGFVMHFDLEKAMTYARIETLTRFPMTDIRAGKYILNQAATIQDIKRAIMKIYKIKTSDPDTYKKPCMRYDEEQKKMVPLRDEFGREISMYEPTVVIIDSIPQLSSEVNENNSKEFEKLMDIGSQTERMRLTGEIGRFYSEMTKYINLANIIVISINQIKSNPQLGIVHSPAEILYLKQDEALPGGKAPQYLSNYLFKFVAVGSEKYVKEDDGFDGFGLQLGIIKSRTNQAGQSVSLVYDKVRGVDSIRSSVEYAKSIGMLGGNKNGYYLGDRKDLKFTRRDMPKDVTSNPELNDLLKSTITDELKQHLSGIDTDELLMTEQRINY